MPRSATVRAAVAVVAIALVAAACTGGGGGQAASPGAQVGQAKGRSLLDVVKQRGTLRCGVNQNVPGFGFLNPDSNQIEGFDIDFCKAIAAAVLGDGSKFELIPVTAEQRFEALRAGQYEVLVRNTTWTSSRDGDLGISFAHPNFYDAQGMMVRKGEFSAVRDMKDATICHTAGTTTELNLADYFQELGLAFKPLVFEENPEVQRAFIAKQCDGWTSDKSQLAGIRSEWPPAEGGPEALEILPDTMSKEPLAPAVQDGDTRWYDVVNWVVNGVILAEEFEVTSQNVQQMVSSPANARVAALLGVPFKGGEPVDSGLGIDIDFMQDVIKAVGNYGEIYDRHVGSQGLGLERGLNALWNASPPGIQYAIPFR
jgi:general L-amino acid transport system substrate-binding protein